MNDAAIDIIDLSKSYKSSSKKAFVHNAVLKSISLRIPQGESVGIIGANGSGKSTLLKIIGNIVKPDGGKVIINGRVLSILELGTGFHPELSGRENIFFNAQMLGVSKKEINEAFKPIVEFSELQEHLDLPVKYYSSGMFMRLAFSIIAHLDADIFLLDEVFSVGDSSFKLKCLAKMRQLQEMGKTILLVSHDLREISTVCTYCVWIDNNKVAMYDRTEHVVSHLSNSIFYKWNKAADPQTLSSRWESQNAALPIKKVVTRLSASGIRFKSSEKISIEFLIEKKSEIPLFFSMSLNHGGDNAVMATSPILGLKAEQIGSYELNDVGTYKLVCQFPDLFFNEGLFTVDLYFIDRDGVEVQKIMGLFIFEVEQDWAENLNKNFNKFPGAFFMSLEWKTTKCKNE